MRITQDGESALIMKLDSNPLTIHFFYTYRKASWYIPGTGEARNQDRSGLHPQGSLLGETDKQVENKKREVCQWGN